MAELRYPLKVASEPLSNYIKFIEFKRVDRNTSRPGDIISLYLPERLMNPSTVSWDNEKLGTIMGFVDNMINGGGIAGGGSNIAQHAANAGAVQTGVLLHGMAGKLLGSPASGESLYAHNSKGIPNPYLTFVFRGVNFRTFEFNFKFYPHSKEEAEMIHKIIKSLRSAAYPTKARGNDYFLRYPSEFILEYHFIDDKGSDQLNKYLNKFKRCVIVGVDTDYTATGGFAVHRTGFPTLISLNLRMTEIEILTSEDIDKDGY